MLLSGITQHIDEYVAGKKWYWYLPLWLFGIYVFWNLLWFQPDSTPPLPILIAQSFDFALHEISHIVTAFLPPILTASAGSTSELLLGSGLVVGAFKGRAYMASLICCLWFTLACQSAGIYMADARAQKLSLVSLGAALSGSDKALHDWHFVFGQLRILNWDTAIGGTVRVVGDLVGLFGLVFTARLLYKMAAAQHLQKATDRTAELKELVMKQGDHEDTDADVSNIYPTPTRR